MNDTFLLLLIALVGIGLGYALGMVFSRPRREDYQTEGEVVAPDSALVEVARLWRVPGERDVYPEIEGQVYNLVDDLTDDQWKRLYQATEDLRYWMKGYLHMAEPAASGPAAPSVSASMEGTDISKKSNSTNNKLRSSTKPTPPSLNPVTVLARAVASDVNVDVSQPSIAAQVDEILQEKLDESPLKSRGIRLMELPNRGMVVMVGMDQYDGVDAVPDPNVRDLIREAVAEWEARVTEDEN
jgi:hypothetical protein